MVGEYNWYGNNWGWNNGYYGWGWNLGFGWNNWYGPNILVMDITGVWTMVIGITVGAGIISMEIIGIP